jgi:hypothetical protein
MARLGVVEAGLAAADRLGAVARLLPTTAAVTLRKGREPVVIDGPFAETKEQLLGFYVVDCGDLEAAIDVARDLAVANPDRGAYEIRPLDVYRPGELTEGRVKRAQAEGDYRGRMTIANIDAAWIDAALTAARPQAVAALLRYFRDLDTAEEAFQDACLRALKAWPKNGPPRDPTAWLILVGRNAGSTGCASRASRRRCRPRS